MGKLVPNSYGSAKNGFLTNSTYKKTYQSDVVDNFQTKVDSVFEFASDYYTIQKEGVNGIYQDLDVRVTTSYSINASSTIKDDFKTLVHKRYDTQLFLGERYYFDGYYWITIDTGRSKASSTSCQVQRCGDFLRFYDDNRIYHAIPAIISKSGIYDLNENTILNLPDNQQRVLIKYNPESDLIKWADENSPDIKFTRVILHGQAWRVVSIDKNSYVRNNIGYLDIRLQQDMVKPTDDLVNNIADGLANNLSIEILNGNSTIKNSTTLQLNVDVINNNIKIINPTIIYTSSDITKATVSSGGLVTGLSVGSTTITATYGNVNDTIVITISTAVTNNYTTDFTSSINNIASLKLSQVETLTVITKNNGISYVDSGLILSLKDDTGINPTTMVSIISQTANTITIKAVNDVNNVGKYFRLYGTGTNNTEYIRIQIKSIF